MRCFETGQSGFVSMVWARPWFAKKLRVEMDNARQLT